MDVGAVWQFETRRPVGTDPGRRTWRHHVDVGCPGVAPVLVVAPVGAVGSV